MGLRLLPPQPLAVGHGLDGFSCGEAVLDDWLRRRALANQLGGGSRTFVVVDGLEQVRGYYSLAAGAVSHRSATGAVRRNMPDLVPVLGRLAVARQAQGRGLGAGLLQDAVRRALWVAQHADVRAREFYLRYGFAPSPIAPLTLMLRLSVAKPAEGDAP